MPAYSIFFADTGSHYTTDRTKWFIKGTAPTNLTAPSGPHGERALIWLAPGHAVGQPLGSLVEVTGGIWAKVGDGATWPDRGLYLITVSSGLTDDSLISLVLGPSGTLEVWLDPDGVGTKINYTVPPVLTNGGDHRIEFRVTESSFSGGGSIVNPDGTYAVYGDGQQVMTGIGLIIGEPNTDWSRIYLGPYVTNGSGANTRLLINETYMLGDDLTNPPTPITVPHFRTWRVERLDTTGAGHYTEWTAGGGGANYLQVDDAAEPDGDTSYVVTSTVNARDTYAMSDLAATTGHVRLVQQIGSSKRPAALSVGPTALLRSGTSDATGSFYGTTTTYRYGRTAYNLSPFTGLEWTFSEVNGLEAGVKATSAGSPPDFARLTQLLLEVVVTDEINPARSRAQIIG